MQKLIYVVCCLCLIAAWCSSAAHAESMLFNKGNTTVMDETIDSGYNWATQNGTEGDNRLHFGRRANGEIHKALVKIDVSSMAGTYAPGSVLGATLRFYYAGAFDPAHTSDEMLTVNFYAVSTANAAWNADTACWNHLNYLSSPIVEWAGSTGLSAPGIDFDATPLASIPFKPSVNYEGSGPFTISLPGSLIERWISVANGGILIACDPLPTNTVGQVFATEISSNPQYGANLTVYYTPITSPRTCQEVWAAGQGMLGDINKDCKIDFKDFAALAAQWMMNNNP